MSNKKTTGDDTSLLVLGGLALLALGKSEDKGKNGGGEKPTGRVFPAGQIDSVTVSRQATMGSHKLTKVYGEFVGVTIKWKAATKDSKGVAIVWDYRPYPPGP